MMNVVAFCVSPCKSLQMRLTTSFTAPHFSPFAQPAIQSPILNLQRFDFWAWATYTDIQKVAMLLGSTPPKLDRQHEDSMGSPNCSHMHTTHVLNSIPLSPREWEKKSTDDDDDSRTFSKQSLAMWVRVRTRATTMRGWMSV